MISNMISYHMEYLTVLSPEAVAFHIEGIAACLRPSTVELTLPLNAAKCLQLPFAIVAGNRCRCQSWSVFVQADALRMGRISSTRQAYGRDMTLLSLFRQATGQKELLQ